MGFFVRVLKHDCVRSISFPVSRLSMDHGYGMNGWLDGWIIEHGVAYMRRWGHS